MEILKFFEATGAGICGDGEKAKQKLSECGNGAIGNLVKSADCAFHGDMDGAKRHGQEEEELPAWWLIFCPFPS